jgi:hypothetical protein
MIRRVDVVDADRSKRLPGTLLAYAFALAVFLLVPPNLHPTVGPPTWFTLQEAVDLLTPVVLIPLAWFALDCCGVIRGRTLVAFLIIAAVWVEGQGIHLAANAIGDAFARGAARDAFYATDAGDLDHWLDEVLSHWMWHLAWAALAILMLGVATRRRVWPTGPGGATSGIAGILHGVTFFFVTTEGATTALGIPVSILLLAWSAGLTCIGSSHPVVRFMLVSSAATLLVYVGWAALNGGRLVEPCEVLSC